MPIYKIELTATEAALKHDEPPRAVVTQTRLVSAVNQARAVAHVVKDSVKVEPCSVADAVALGADGVKVEEAE